MAVTRTVIDIYNDAGLTDLEQEVLTNSDANPVDVQYLAAGTRYWATITVTDDGVTSPASAKYQFITLPEVYFTSVPALVGGTSIAFSVQTTHPHVGVDQCGVVVGTDPDFIVNPLYALGAHGADSVQDVVTGLQPNTTYFLAPIVYDSLGRVYRDPVWVSVTTGSEEPSVAVIGVARTTPIAADINIQIG